MLLLPSANHKSHGQNSIRFSPFTTGHEIRILPQPDEVVSLQFWGVAEGGGRNSCLVVIFSLHVRSWWKPRLVTNRQTYSQDSVPLHLTLAVHTFLRRHARPPQKLWRCIWICNVCENMYIFAKMVLHMSSEELFVYTFVTHSHLTTNKNQMHIFTKNASILELRDKNTKNFTNAQAYIYIYTHIHIHIHI